MFLIIVIYIVFISLGLPDSLFGVVWPVVHREFGVVESFASVYSVIVAMTSGGVSFFAGRLIRKFGTGRVTFVSVLLTAVGLLGTSFAPNLWVMMFFSVVMGYGAGAIDTGLNNYVSLHYKASHMNWLHCFWGVGVTVSPIIMSAFLSGETGSWRTGYRIIAAIQFCIALIAAISLPHWKDSESGGATAGDENEKNKKANIFAVKGVLTSTLSLGLYCGMEFLIGTWGASYLVNTFALSPDSAAKWISLYYGGIMLGRLVSGFVSMKTSDNTLIRAGIVISFAGMFLLTLPIGTPAFFGLLLIGFGFGPIFPSVLHSVPGRFGNELSADITGFHMGGAYALGFLIQVSFGYIASATTFYITPFVLLAVAAALFTVNEVTIRTVAKRNAEE